MAVKAKVIEPPAARLDWSRALAWRTAKQHLDRRVPLDQYLAVTSRLCGLHAQLTSSAELTLWARVEGLQPDTVSNALWQDRTLVKTWAMRGTLHFLPADEYWDWQAVLDTYDNYTKPAWNKYFGVSPDELKQLLAAIDTALDGQVLTRKELADRVSEISGSAALGEKLAESWGSVLKPASYQGRLCFGPSQGQNVGFTRPDTWLRHQRPTSVDAPLKQAFRRFLAAYGPATLDDYGRWLAFTPAQVKAQLKSLGDEVCQVEVEGSNYYLLKQDLAEIQAATPLQVARLVPAFDPYIIGATRQVEQLTPGDFKDKIYRPQGWISPILLVDGRMEGTWKSEQKGRKVLVTIEQFREQPAWVKAQIEAEAERLAEFLGGNLELEWKS